MAYDEFLSDRIKQVLDEKKVHYSAKKMMGGLTFMVDNKMCVGIVKENLMARIGPDVYAEALKKPGCIEMNFTGHPMKGHVFVEPTAVVDQESLEYWIDLCLDFNPLAKSTKKK